MTFFLKLRHWELFLMLALPTIMSLMFKIPFGPMVSASIGLFMLFVLFAWMFSIGAWSNRHLPKSRRRSVIPFGISLVLPIIYVLMYIFLYIPLLNNGAPSRSPLWMLPMHMFSMVGIFYGIWLIQPEVNQLYHKLEQPNPDTDGT
jgi:hypothetical protein